MLGAVTGDIAGSRFEWANHKGKDFELLPKDRGCHPTDDSVCTLAVARSILDCHGDYNLLGMHTVRNLQNICRMYPHAGYGGRFAQWIISNEPKPYRSYGNGAAMRVSPCGFAARSLREAMQLADTVTNVTHDHPESIRAARAVASFIYLARTEKSLDGIREYIEDNFYKIDFLLDEIRSSYAFDVTCQGSVPQAFEALYESKDFEDAIRNAISIGGDSDTIAAITGGMAQALYGIPNKIKEQTKSFLDDFQLKILEEFETAFEIN